MKLATSKQDHFRNQNHDIWGGSRLGRIVPRIETVDFGSTGRHAVHNGRFHHMIKLFKFKIVLLLLNDVHFDLCFPVFRFGA